MNSMDIEINNPEDWQFYAKLLVIYSINLYVLYIYICINPSHISTLQNTQIIHYDPRQVLGIKTLSGSRTADPYVNHSIISMGNMLIDK